MVKKNSGITLVALVITIIVLLILSGITISALTGNSSLIDKAMQSKEDTEYAQIKEEVLDEWYKLEYEKAKSYNSFEQMGSDFQSRLLQKDARATVEYKDDTKTLEISYKGHTMNLTEKGKLIENN